MRRQTANVVINLCAVVCLLCMVGIVYFIPPLWNLCATGVDYVVVAALTPVAAMTTNVCSSMAATTADLMKTAIVSTVDLAAYVNTYLASTAASFADLMYIAVVSTIELAAYVNAYLASMAATMVDLSNNAAVSALNLAHSVKAQAATLAMEAATQVITTASDIAITAGNMYAAATSTLAVLVWGSCAMWVLCKLKKWNLVAYYSGYIAAYACMWIAPAAATIYATYDEVVMCIDVLAWSVFAVWSMTRLWSFYKQVSCNVDAAQVSSAKATQQSTFVSTKSVYVIGFALAAAGLAPEVTLTTTVMASTKMAMILAKLATAFIGVFSFLIAKTASVMYYNSNALMWAAAIVWFVAQLCNFCQQMSCDASDTTVKKTTTQDMSKWAYVAGFMVSAAALVDALTLSPLVAIALGIYTFAAALATTDEFSKVSDESAPESDHEEEETSTSANPQPTPMAQAATSRPKRDTRTQNDQLRRTSSSSSTEIDATVEIVEKTVAKTAAKAPAAAAGHHGVNIFAQAVAQVSKAAAAAPASTSGISKKKVLANAPEAMLLENPRVPHDTKEVYARICGPA